MSKNLKHGIKVGKRDIVLSTCYVVNVSSFRKVFNSKLDAVNFLSELMFNDYDMSNVSLFKVQSLKF